MRQVVFFVLLRERGDQDSSSNKGEVRMTDEETRGITHFGILRETRLWRGKLRDRRIYKILCPDASELRMAGRIVVAQFIHRILRLGVFLLDLSDIDGVYDLYLVST
ncbi:MAG: hypothetical protein AMJ91_02035 [candidate division Zixibacteria bacterium SM23_73_3]|nr:MAG: hypothetical protein AMJ91_02035 [candidate division Zixibacteria bacterium SM23_73_3]